MKLESLPSPLRLLVCGGRHYGDRRRLWIVLDALHVRKPVAVLIEGDAPGADRLAGEWARARGIDGLTYPAAWDDLTAPGAVVRTRRDGTPYNAKAGFDRNERMLREGKPDLVLAFPGGNGTRDMMRQARLAGVPVIEIA